MARDYTALPHEYLEELDCLSDAEYGRLIRALQTYSINGEEIQLNGREKDHWKRVRNREDRYKASYATNSANGKKGGRPESEEKRNKANESEIKPTKTKAKAKTETNTETESSIKAQECAERSPLEIAMDDFAKARKAMKKPLTVKARELTLLELEKLAPGDDAMKVAIINQSIQRGWQGVFPLKEDEQRKPKTKSHLPPVPGPLEGGDDLDRLMRMVGLND